MSGRSTILKRAHLKHLKVKNHHETLHVHEAACSVAQTCTVNLFLVLDRAVRHEALVIRSHEQLTICHMSAVGCSLLKTNILTLARQGGVQNARDVRHAERTRLSPAFKSFMLLTSKVS